MAKKGNRGNRKAHLLGRSDPRPSRKRSTPRLDADFMVKEVDTSDHGIGGPLYEVDGHPALPLLELIKRNGA